MRISKYTMQYKLPNAMAQLKCDSSVFDKHRSLQKPSTIPSHYSMINQCKFFLYISTSTNTLFPYQNLGTIWVFKDHQNVCHTLCHFHCLLSFFCLALMGLLQFIIVRRIDWSRLLLSPHFIGFTLFVHFKSRNGVSRRHWSSPVGLVPACQ